VVVIIYYKIIGGNRKLKITYRGSLIEKIILVVGILLILYIPFVTIDCFRLKRTNIMGGMKPLITIRTIDYETSDEKGTKYIGLGYSLKYYTTIQFRRRIYGSV